MKEHTEKEGILTEPKRMLKSSYFLEKGTIILPLLLFYLDLGLVGKKNCRFVQHIPMKCFNSLVQSAANATRKGDESPNSSFVAETKKVLANSYGYQIMDQKRFACVAKHFAVRTLNQTT